MSIITLKITLRKIKSSLIQLLAMGVLVVIGTSFFLAISSIADSYRDTANEYFNSSNYADATLYGLYDEGMIQALREEKNVKAAEGRNTQDYYVDNGVIRAVSITDNINHLYLYSGTFPDSSDECVILHKYAQAHNISVGDSFLVDGKIMNIVGIAGSPEYVYLVRSANTAMANVQQFGVIFVPPSFFEGKYNEVVLLKDGDLNIDELKKTEGTFTAFLKEDQINFTLYEEDVAQISLFALIFPVVFALLILAVMYVMLKRIISKEHKQIGTMKAMGLPDGKVMMVYIVQIMIVALFATMIGCIISILLGNVVIDLLSFMFEVPNLHYRFYPHLWVATIFTPLVICLLSGLVSVKEILKSLPAQALQVRMPTGGKRSIFECVPFVRKTSFNTRYALKSATRNKGRFIAVLMGMCGAICLLVFSLGFKNSIDNTQTQYIKHFADYDITIDFPAIPIDELQPCIYQVEEAQKSLQKSEDVNGKKIMTAIVYSDFDMLELDKDKLESGVIIPESFAEEWNVKVGDSTELYGHTVTISDIIPLTMRLSTFTSYEYLQSLDSDFPVQYNRIYAKSNNLATLEQWLNENEYEHNSMADIKSGFDSILEGINMLIVIMIICSTALGMTVLYAVGLINLTSREFEYMYMNIMGYPIKSIVIAQVKEYILQLCLSIPVGFALGYLLVFIIKDSFSGDNFIIQAFIYPTTFLFALGIVLVVTVLNIVMTARHINKMNIVEGLKVQDE